MRCSFGARKVGCERYYCKLSETSSIVEVLREILLNKIEDSDTVADWRQQQGAVWRKD